VVIERWKSGFGGLLAACALAAGPLSLCAQDVAVTYRNARDDTRLSAMLAVPNGAGHHPGVVLLSIAGTDPLVERLVADGYVVLTPERRGFVSVEPLLRATYDDLADDVRAAVDFLRNREEVDGAAVALVAQADDAPPTLLAAASDAALPLVLLAPPVFSGTETFRLEQRAQAERAGMGRDGLEALDDYVGRIAEIALSDAPPYVREYRLQGLRAGSSVQLPRSAAFPSDERQAHFFASPLWHDRLAFEPGAVLARLRAPVLVLIGADDADTPMDDWLAAVRAGLAGSSSTDVTVCRISGRTRHTFTPEGVRALSEWLVPRVGPSAPARPPPVLSGCLADADR
jgi:dienelactone hydrolase